MLQSMIAKSLTHIYQSTSKSWLDEDDDDEDDEDNEGNEYKQFKYHVMSHSLARSIWIFTFKKY